MGESRIKVYIESYGCWLNKALAEAIKQTVESLGGTVVHKPDEASMIIVNTCAVRAESERKILERIKELSGIGARLAVTGCLVNVRPYSILEAAPEAALVDPTCLSMIKTFLKGESIRVVRKYGSELPTPKYAGGPRYVLAVQVGCLGSCGFCVERVVRKGVVSLEPETVVKLVKDAVGRGAKEVFLTGQDLASYGVDKGVNLTNLIEQLLSNVEGDYRIRLGMMEPWLVSRMVEKLARLMKDPRIYNYVHLPVQSGDDRVLRSMGRRYTVKDYENLVLFIKRELSDHVTVATDFIVGYPGERWNAFLNSVRLVRKLEFDKVHVARYTFRPFTPAYIADKQVPEPEKKKRSRILSRVAMEVAAIRNSMYVGRVLEALVVEKGKHNTLVARTNDYKPVIISTDTCKVGDRVKIRVTGYTSIHLIGEVVD